MRAQWLGLMLFVWGLVIGCQSHHQPLSGPESDPLTYPPVRGQAARQLPTLHEIPTGVADDYQAYPVLEPDEIVRVWVVGQTRSDIVHVHGHWLTINYRPSRFKPDEVVTRNRVPTGRLLDKPKERDNPTESSQVPLRFGQSAPSPPPSTTAPVRDETQAVRQAYEQIQQYLPPSGASRAVQPRPQPLPQTGVGGTLEQQIREMTRQIQQRSTAPAP
jgi:hypothetical protein